MLYSNDVENGMVLGNYDDDSDPWIVTEEDEDGVYSYDTAILEEQENNDVLSLEFIVPNEYASAILNADVQKKLTDIFIDSVHKEYIYDYSNDPVVCTFIPEITQKVEADTSKGYVYKRVPDTNNIGVNIDMKFTVYGDYDQREEQWVNKITVDKDPSKILDRISNKFNELLSDVAKEYNFKYDKDSVEAFCDLNLDDFAEMSHDVEKNKKFDRTDT